ncbi:hypothetical protein BJV82DRAFT_629600 [Fennellomyces sp. T-0311]|nr:hypothetical protein BJV82DRAFT_629600 [Fennellomyces sp. T-0311]
MGAVFSKSKAPASDDYERILSDLDERIQKAEIKLSEEKLRERRWAVMWVIYSLILWVIYSLYCFLALRNPERHDFESIVLLTAPVLAVPVGIYYIRQLLKRFFAWSQNRAESQLQTLRAEQKLKLDELKKNTAYYSTQSLIDRYDETQRKTQKRPPPQPKKSQPQPPAPAPQANMQQLKSPPIIAPPRQPQWYDRVVDAIVGDAGPDTKFALICNFCFTHNGLVMPEEVDTIQYRCRSCQKLNSSRKSRQLHPDGPVVPPSPAPSVTAVNEIGDKETSKPEETEEEEEDDANDTIASRVRRRHHHAAEDK